MSTTATRRTEISVDRAAKMLQISRVQVRRYLEDGTLDGYQRTERGWWTVFLDSVERVVNKRNGGQ